MTYNYRYLFLILTSLFLNSFFSQENYFQTFRSPVGIPISLSGNFGELRSNHFHTGLDIKTNGSINYRIYAIDTGFVSRINISHWGYGKAIYIDHPNGFTSVYAHLNHFPEKIEKIIRQKQYELHQESITYYLDSSQILVSKGEIIAFSGNSGSSSGPHLHFEIRETQSEHPVNPQQFNFEILDNRPPVISQLKVYNFPNKSINLLCSEKVFSLKKFKNSYRLNNDSIIYVSGPFGIGVAAADYYTNSSNLCGIYSIKMYVDEVLKYDLKFDELDFDNNHQINIHKDFNAYQEHRHKIHRLFIHPNNELEIYNRSLGNGLINFKDSSLHKVKIKVADFNNNYSELYFHFLHKDSSSCLENKNDFDKYIFSKDSNWRISLDSNSFYNFPKIKLKSQNNNVEITNNLPVKNQFILSMKITSEYSPYIEKTFVANITKKGNILNKSGKIDEKWISAEVKKMGTYQLIIDTVAPTIIHLGNNRLKKMNQSLNFKISDDLSGVENYDVYIDELWVLSNYSYKTSKLRVPLDKYTRITNGEHNCRLLVSDERNNKSSLDFKFKFNTN